MTILVQARISYHEKTMLQSEILYMATGTTIIITIDLLGTRAVI